MKYYLAVDIGASSGRHIVGWMEDGKIRTREVYRFPNGVTEQGGHLTWDNTLLTELEENGGILCFVVAQVKTALPFEREALMNKHHKSVRLDSIIPMSPLIQMDLPKISSGAYASP